MPRKIQHYGWVAQSPDKRDHKLATATFAVGLPSSVDMRSGSPHIFDQLNLGSCTANAIAAAVNFERAKQAPVTEVDPSRLFIYYNERLMEGTASTDSGAIIRDGFKSIASQGTCPETDWPYDVDKFAVQPTTNCYAEATHNVVDEYLAVNQDLNSMKSCLASGYPFVFGFTVYESFESSEVAQTGVVPMPTTNEPVVGGHAVLCLGYDDSSSMFLCQNSWSSNWGQKGFFEMPYAYLTDQDLSADFWSVRLVQLA